MQVVLGAGLALLSGTIGVQFSGARTADVVPTVFYKCRNGQLVELVDVVLRSGSRLVK